MNTGATMVTDEQRLHQLGMATLSDKAKSICEQQYRLHGPIAGCSSCPLASPCRANPVHPRGFSQLAINLFFC